MGYTQAVKRIRLSPYSRTFFRLFLPLAGVLALISFIIVPSLLGLAIDSQIKRLPSQRLEDLRLFEGLYAFALQSDEREKALDAVMEFSASLSRIRGMQEIAPPARWYMRLRDAKGEVVREIGSNAAEVPAGLAARGIAVAEPSELGAERTVFVRAGFFRYALLIQLPVRASGGAVLGSADVAVLPSPRLFAPVLFTQTMGLSASIFSILAFAAFAACFAAAFGLSRRISRLRSEIEAIASGDFGAVREIRSKDDIGLLEAAVSRIGASFPFLLEKRQELAALEERNRIARDLHDGVKQDLVGLSFRLASVKDSKAAESVAPVLEELEATSRKALSDLDAFVKKLMPVKVTSANVASLIASEAEAFAKRGGLRLSMSADEGFAGADFRDELAAAFFWTAREAFSNCVRHSGARNLEVRLGMGASGPELAVRDDGRGFDPGERSDGVGLDSMRARLSMAGGACEIESSPGEGTTVHARSVK